MRQSPTAIRPAYHQFILAGLLCLLLLGLLTFAIHWVLSDHPLGPDFFTFWLSGRALFTENANPYSQQVTLQSQMGIYGRPALPTEDQVAFAYPPYSLFMILPTIWMDFAWAQAFWLSVNLIFAIIVLLLISQRMPKAVAIISLTFYPITFGLILGNFAVPISMFLLLLFGIVLRKDKSSTVEQIVCGVFLGWMTIKPQFVWLFLLFILLLLWKRKLYPMLASFFVSVIVWISLSFLLVPTWLSDWLRRIGEYAGYVRSQPVLTGLLNTFLQPPLPLLITILAALASLAFTFYWIRLWWMDRIPTLAALAWLGFLTYLFHPHGIAYEQIAFLIPLILFAVQSGSRWSWKAILLFCTAVAISWGFFLFTRYISPNFDHAPIIIFGLWLLWYFLRCLNNSTEVDLRTSNN